MECSDLHSRISGLRSDALDALGALTRSDISIPPDQVGRLVAAMQRASNQLGSVLELLMPPVSDAAPDAHPA